MLTNRYKQIILSCKPIQQLKQDNSSQHNMRDKINRDCIREKTIEKRDVSLLNERDNLANEFDDEIILKERKELSQQPPCIFTISNTSMQT